jgi:hypothetical protein
VHIKSGYVPRHSDLLAILLLVAIVFVGGPESTILVKALTYICE